MNDKHLYLALLKIKNNTDINELRHEGLTYGEITGLIKNIIEKGYMTETEELLTLSETGIAIFKELEITYKKTNKDEWISYDKKNLIKKLKKNDIFVPRSNELTFKVKNNK